MTMMTSTAERSPSQAPVTPGLVTKDSGAAAPISVTRSFGGRLLVSVLTVEPDAEGWVSLENQTELTLMATGETLGHGLSLPPGAVRRLLVTERGACERAILLYPVDLDEGDEPVCARINVRVPR
jgi:hypothetical protein